MVAVIVIGAAAGWLGCRAVGPMPDSAANPSAAVADSLIMFIAFSPISEAHAAAVASLLMTIVG